MAVQIQFRNDTAANWTAANPILALGELGLESDTGQFKVGNGVQAWNSRPYGGIVGPQGPTGLTGPTYLGVTSTTTSTISPGSTTFSVSSTGAFTVGTRVRVASTTSPTNWEEGIVTAVVLNTSITVNVDITNGSGTFSAWTFSVAGQIGPSGETAFNTFLLMGS
jgi:hypothetical protein